MKQTRINIHRRNFLKTGTLAIASVAIGMRTGASEAAERVDENGATAKSLGYRNDATKADKAKFPKYVAGEECMNCQLFQGKPGEEWGPCPIFGGKLVHAKGWCSAYIKKS